MNTDQQEIADLRRRAEMAEADAAAATEIFVWMVSFGDNAMAAARTLHYDMRGKAQQYLALRSPGAALLAELEAARGIIATLRRHYDAGGEVWGSIDRDLAAYDQAVKASKG